LEDIYDRGSVLHQLGNYEECVVVLRECCEMSSQPRYENLVDRAGLARMLGDALAQTEL